MTGRRYDDDAGGDNGNGKEDQQRRVERRIRIAEDLVDVLRVGGSDVPLEDRPVLLPVGKKAFAKGRLCPETTTTIAATTATDTATNAAEEVVELDGRRLTRHRARQVLREELELLKKEQQRQQQQQKKKAIVPDEPAAPSRRGQASSSQQTLQQHPHPLVEIREVVDERGHVVSADVVDVSRQLRAFERIAEGEQVGEEAVDDAPSLADARTTLRPASTTTTDDRVAEGEEEAVERGGGGRETTTAQQKQQQPAARLQKPQQIVSDEEYDILSNRLEELLRLEQEESEETLRQSANAVETGKLKQKLRGQQQQGQQKKTIGGWSKGFLNKPSAATKKTKKPPPQPAPPPVQQQQQQQHKTTASDANGVPSAVGGDGEEEAGATKKKTSPPSVSFGDDSDIQVKEIPRIGTRSARELRKPQSQFRQPQPTHPRIDESPLFSGIVQERQQQRRSTAPQRQGVVAETAAATRTTAAAQSATPSQPPQRKRLSRFAMERQQMRG